MVREGSESPEREVTKKRRDAGGAVMRENRRNEEERGERLEEAS
jgi:hypothetical protein